MTYFPQQTATFNVPVPGGVIYATDIAAIQSEIKAIETALLSGVTFNFAPSGANTYSLGTSAASWLSLFLRQGTASATYSGSGIPNSVVPSGNYNLGDTYLNTANNAYYVCVGAGSNSSSTWVNTVAGTGGGSSGNVTIVQPYPFVSFQGTESGAIRENIQEINGDWYFLSNASYNTGTNLFSCAATGGAALGFRVTGPNSPTHSQTQFISHVATASTWATGAWTVAGFVDSSGNETLNGTLTVSSITSNSTLSISGNASIAGNLSVGASGSITLLPLVQGSVVFAGAGNLLSQDNANLFWDNVNKRLGIGTAASPAVTLDVGGILRSANMTSSNTFLTLRSFYTGAGAPSSSTLSSGTYKVGDEYFNTSNYSTYTCATSGSQSSSVWVQDGIQTGVIQNFTGATSAIPLGNLATDGSSYATSAYPDLFNKVGYQYGGSGANFNVPNTQGLVLMNSNGTYTLATTGGEYVHTLIVGEIPSHGHTYGDPGHSHDPSSGILQAAVGGGGAQASAAGSNLANVTLNDGYIGITINNTGGSGSHNNLQPYMAITHMIKT